MQRFILSFYLMFLLLGLMGCTPMMTLRGDVGVGNNVRDRDRLEAVLEESGLARAMPEDPIDEAGRIQSGDKIVSFFALKNYRRFLVTVYYLPKNGALTFFGEERSPNGFGVLAQECISKISVNSKNAFGDRVSIKVEATSSIVL